MKLCIFDVDGTLVESKSGATFRKSADDWQWMPGRLEKLKMLRESDIKLAVATNQGGVAFGYFEKSDITREILKVVEGMTGISYYPSALYICYTHPKAKIEEYQKDDDIRRKPGPGMLLEAMETFGVGPKDTLFVGDREEDRLAAEAAKIDFEWAWAYFGDSPSSSREPL